MKTLYVIGNGFDLHHDIKSSYRDYREWLSKNHPTLLSQIDNFYPYSHCKSWWNEFEENLGFPEMQEAITNAVVSARQERAEKFDRDLTVDEENVKDFIGTDLEDLVESIERTFHDWVVSMNKPNCLKKIKMDLTDAICINFNYSNTLEDLYNAENVVHIHGQVSRNQSIKELFVLGHGRCKSDVFQGINDEFDIQYDPRTMSPKDYACERASSNDDILARKVASDKIEKLQKDVDGIIKQNSSLFNSLKNVERVFIYGLSFGEVDLKYLDKVISSVSKNCEYTISYYSNSDSINISSYFDAKNLNYRLVRLNDLCRCPIVRFYLKTKNLIHK